MTSSTDILAICAAIPQQCKQSTIQYVEYIDGFTFEGIAKYSNELKTGIGSCGFEPSSLEGIPVVAMPLPFMFMSYQPDICNTYCNSLCGSFVEVTNTQTGKSLAMLITDTASTEDYALVLSEDGYLALGGTIAAGRTKITFRRINPSRK